MAQAETTKANKLAYLHLRVVFRVLRRLLEHAVVKENPDWTMDQFLFHRMGPINQHNIGNRNQGYLFPGFRENANVDSWPLYLFPFLIVYITDRDTLHNDIYDTVRQMNQSRLELYSNIVRGISDEYFAEHVNKVRLAIQRICQILQDEQFTDDIHREIMNVEEMKENPDNIDYVEEFNINHQTEKSYRQRVTEFTLEQENLHEIVKMYDQIRGDQVSEEGQKDVSIRYEDHFRDLDEAQREGHDLSNRHLPSRSGTSKYPIEIPALTVEIEIKGCSSTEIHHVSRRIVNSINTTGEQGTDQANRTIKNTFDNTFTSFGEYYAKQGCIQVVVHPRSIQDMFQLLDGTVKGILTENLKPVQDLIRTLVNYQHYKQKVVLYKDNYDYVMDNIALQLTKQLTVQESRFKPKPRVKAEASENGNVLLHVECNTPEDRAAFRYALQAGHMQPTLDVLKKELQHICPNFSVSARLHKHVSMDRGHLHKDETALQGVKTDARLSTTKISLTGVRKCSRKKWVFRKAKYDYSDNVGTPPDEPKQKEGERLVTTSMSCSAPSPEKIIPIIRSTSVPLSLPSRNISCH